MRNLNQTEIKKAMSLNDVARNPLLDQVTIAAFQDPKKFIAAQLFGTIPVADQVGKYTRFDQGSLRINSGKLRAPGTPVEYATMEAGQVSFSCEQIGFGQVLTREMMKTFAVSEPAVAAALAEALLINSEIRFGSAYWKTGVWGIDMAGVVSGATGNQINQWNGASSTPIDDILALKLRILLSGGREPNVMALGAEAANKLLTNPQIVNRLNNGQTPNGPASATLQDLAKLFGLEKVIVASGVYNAANEGVAENATFCLNTKSAWIGYVDPNPSVLQTTAGIRFAWEGNAGNPTGVHTYSWYDQAVFSQRVVTLCDDVYAIVNNKNGSFISAAVA